MQPSTERLSKLLLTLYAAPAQPDLWPVFLQDFSSILGLPGAAILHQNLAEDKYGFSVAVGVDPAAQTAYGDHFGRNDPFRPSFLKRQEGELCFGDELCPSPVLRKTEMYGDYLTKHDFTLYCSVATIRQAETSEFISIYRGLQSKHPNKDTVATIRMLLPHIRAALKLRSQLCLMDSSTKNYSDALDSLNVGVVLLNERGECLFVSRKAENICSAKGSVFIRQSQMGAHARTDHEAIRGLIHRAIAMGVERFARPCGTISVGGSPGRLLNISATALSSLTPSMQMPVGSKAVAAVFIRAPEDDAVSLRQILTNCYALTTAELRLAIQLFEGWTLVDAAARNSVSLETVRAQLKAVFNKTDTRRQSELILLLSRLTLN
jgi:DNA-binding CsgD family transcriptional regulator/PAS domain-containing protein